MIKKISFYSSDIFLSHNIISDGGANYLPLNPDQAVGTGQCMNNYFEILLVEHMHSVLKYPAYNISKASRQQLLVTNIMRCLDSCYDQNISIEDLSNLFHFSPSYLMTTFKKHTGKSIGEYITELKLNYAKEMLKNNDLTLTEISQRLNFTSLQYFSAFFKSQTGLSPSEYRKDAAH